MEAAANTALDYTMRLLRMQSFQFQLRQTGRMNAHVSLPGFGLEAGSVHETQPNRQPASHVRTTGNGA